MNSMLMVAGYVSLRHQIHPGGHCTSRSPMTQAGERIFIPWRPTVLLRHLGIGLDAWRRQDKVRQSQCIISVAVHPGKAACPPPLWDMRRGKACYQVSQVQDEPCVGCKPFRCHVWLGPHLSHQDRAKADVRGCGQQWSWGFEWEKMLEHEFFKARTFFFLYICTVQKTTTPDCKIQAIV